MWREEHAAAFTVAKAMQLDVLSDMHNAVAKAVEKGQSFESFKKNIADAPAEGLVGQEKNDRSGYGENGQRAVGQRPQA